MKTNRPLQLSLRLLAVAVTLLLHCHVVLVQGLEVVTPIIDHAQCYSDLSDADSDRSNELTSKEYMVFISLQSNGRYAPDTPLVDMPLSFASAFNLSACNCRDGSCCSPDSPPTVNIAGADLPKGEVPTEDQEKHLFHVCVAAFNAILQAEMTPPTEPPTEEPTASPTTTPTASPTAEPTASPTIFLFTGDLELTFTFPFENDGGFTAEDINNADGNTIKSDLEIAIGQMVQGIVEEQEQAGTVRHMRGRTLTTRGLRRGRQPSRVMDAVAHVDASYGSSTLGSHNIGHGGNEGLVDGTSRRHLAVAYNGQVPPTVEVENVDCPDGTQEARAVSPNTKCSIITATVTLSVEDESPDEVRSKYLQAIVNEIDSGALADVGVVGPAEPNFPTNSPEIMTENPGGEKVTPDGPSEGALSTPAVIGIAVAAFAAGLVAVAGLYTQRRQQRRASKTDDFPPSPEISTTGKTQPADSSNGTLGAAAANYGHASNDAPPASASSSASPARKGFQEIQEVDPDDELSLASSDVSSSQAGSSGWSSSAGVSSINTGSHDGSSFDLEGGGARVNTLAALGVASGVTSRLDDRRGRDSGLQFIPVPANQPPSLQAQNDGSSSTLEDVPTVPSVDRNDLDAAIEAGDWAAVGATAALLASSTSETGDSSVNTDSQSGHSASEGKLSDIDAERAAALDRMVDSGDWEGVVLAASKFETASVEESSRSRTDDDDDDNDNDQDEHSHEVVETRDSHSMVPSKMAGSPSTPSGVTKGNESANGALSPATDSAGSASTGDVSNGTDESSSTSSSSASASASADDPSDSVLSPGTSTHSAGASSGLSETPSKVQKRAEIRAEVELLVRRVVPDEIDNVDEMMTQFKGREEELVETLRTMQERSIAQRERVARNKSAKREAKLGVRRARKTQASLAASTGSTGSGLPPAGPHSATAAGNQNGAAAAIGTSTALAMAVVGSSSQKSEEGGNDEKDGANPGSKAIGPVVSPLVNKEEDASIGLAPSLSKSRSSEGTNFSDSHFESSQTEASSAMASSAMSGSGMDSTDFGASTEYTSAAASKYDADASGTENESEEDNAPVNTNPPQDKVTTQSPAPTQNTDGSGTDVKRARYALERAIEAGDWEAVGEAAALMSDNSVASADTSELRNIANIGEYDSSGYMSEGTGSKRSGTTGTDTTGPNAERAAELDKKIAQGDWEGVVLAAKSFSKIDSAAKKGAEVAESRNSVKSSTKSKSWRLRRMFGGGKGSSRTNASVDTDSEVDSVSKKNSDKALQEEQDALAQAEIWMAIAAQSKQEGTSEPTGASDAADWAISRSLSALQAEQKEDALKGDNECKGISSSSSMGSAGSKGDKSV